jgi:ribosomal protein L11 methyltransferase
MNWHQLSIPAPEEHLDGVCARLSALGYDSLLFEEGRVVLYLPDTSEGRESVSALRGHFGALSDEILQQDDWENAWKQYYKPIPIGERLLIQPAWEPLNRSEARAVFYNNPGMSFGTGLHASTRIVLNFLESRVRPGQRVLDLGCGSGILSICALLLGADEATAVDIDPLAARTAAENAERNGVAARYAVLCGDALSDAGFAAQIPGGWDIVCCNIVADVVLAFADFVADRLAPGGLWLVSGLIDARVDEVRAALSESGWAERAAAREEGWGGLVLGRGGAL